MVRWKQLSIVRDDPPGIVYAICAFTGRSGRVCFSGGCTITPGLTAITTTTVPTATVAATVTAIVTSAIATIITITTIPTRRVQQQQVSCQAMRSASCFGHTETVRLPFGMAR
uniref:Uncharacterized protein n=1 Tax=Haptolina brevifila TaxID=156173 RepID=A0A7S2C7J4_9EUKA|mmetsp:Transcript_21128/g.42818  ORF Transcript_21128/g.42818 Transcript_21128/m.42818 type:complete len:113 (+) Transcript_21128:106-444(+)